MLVDDLLRSSADRHPDRESLVSGGRRLTFAALDSAVQRFAAGLQSLGVVRGDRVAVHLDNNLEAVIAILGTLRAGAAFVPVNPTTKADKLAYLLADSGAAVLVSDGKALRVVSDAVALCREAPARVLMVGGAVLHAEIASVPVVPFEQVARCENVLRERVRIDLDLAALIYTSGSTGRPKGVMMSHGHILSATTSINGYLENSPEDTILDVLPLSFDYGLYQLFLALQGGSRILMERSFVFPAVMLELMAKERVTGLPIVPMIAALLLKHDLAAYDLGALRYITNTGAVLPPVHIAALRERLPHVRIFSMYGLTECKRVSYLPPEEIDTRPTSVGKPMDNTEVFFLTDDGTLAPTGAGQLVVRGSNVMEGYWRDPDASARALRPWTIPGEHVLYTGDRFRIDDEGWMYFQGRTDDIIKSRGQKVSPREIENVLHAVPGVCEAVVIGISDPVIGEALRAYVTVHAGASVTERDILLLCSRQLEDFMVPDRVEIVASLPHTLSGKLARRALAAEGADSR